MCVCCLTFVRKLQYGYEKKISCFRDLFLGWVSCMTVCRSSVTVYSGTQALASWFWIYFKEMKMIFRKIYRLPSALEPANCILAISFTIGAACLLSSVLAGLPFSLLSSCCCPSVSWFHSFSEIWSFNPNSGVSGVWFEGNSF